MSWRVAVDVGNSSYHAAISTASQSPDPSRTDQTSTGETVAPDAKDRPPHTMRVKTDRPGAADRVVDWVQDFVLDAEQADRGTDIAWMVASVCEPARAKLEEAVENASEAMRWQDIDHRWVDLDHDVDRIEQVGIDRLLAASAGRRLVGDDAIVIDSGSAITIDLVHAGVYRGGVILAGLAMQSRALAGDTDRLFAIDVEANPAPSSVVDIPGRNTSDAILGGLLHATAGAIDRIVETYRVSTARTIPVVATGGDMNRLKAMTRTRWLAVDDLVTGEILRLRSPGKGE